MSDNKKVIGSLLLGVAAGAVIGLLFAPEKGSNTRKKISKSTDDLLDQLQDTIDEGKSALNNFKGKAAQKFSEYKDMAMKSANDIAEDAETEVDYLKRKGRQHVNQS